MTTQADKEHRDYWDGTGQVFFTGGLGFAVSPVGDTFVLGKEASVLEAMKTQCIPEDATPLQRAEYIRLFQLQKENEDAKSRGNIKPVRASGVKRVRNLRGKSSPNSKRGIKHSKRIAFRKRLPGHTVKQE